MNIIRKLTLKQLKLNKKRTLVTILGVIIATSMFTAVSTAVASFQDMNIRNAIRQNGNWRMELMHVTPEKSADIMADPLVRDGYFGTEAGYAILEDGKNPDKPYLFIEAYEEKGLRQQPIRLIEGRLPESESELVLPEHVSKNALVDWKIGDEISLSLGERQFDGTVLGQGYPFVTSPQGEIFHPYQLGKERTYTIVGIMERPDYLWEYHSAPGYTAVTWMAPDSLSDHKLVNTFVTLNELNNRTLENMSVKWTGMDIQSAQDSDLIKINWKLVNSYGISGNRNMDKVIRFMTVILVAIIMTGGISLIHNAFVISLSERGRYLGMLASVGATRKQKRSSVFFEGLVIGGIGIPLGIAAGNLGMAVTFRLLDPMIRNVTGMDIGIRVIISWQVIAATTLMAGVTILISAWIPAFRASRITPLDAIRQNRDIKLTHKMVKTSRLTKKLFGFEGEIALKNIKRNKKRYRAVLFSLLISFILFLSVSAYSFYIRQGFAMSDNSTNYDAMIRGVREDMEEAALLPEVSERVYLRKLNENLYLNPEDADRFYTPLYRELQPKSIEAASIDQASYLFINVSAMDEKSLGEYAKALKLDMRRLSDTENPGMIVINKTRSWSENKLIEAGIFTEGALGIKLTAFYDAAADERTVFEPLEDLEVLALTDRPPMGLHFSQGFNSIEVIVSEQVFEKLRVLYFKPAEGTSEIPEADVRLFLKSDKPKQLSESLERIRRERSKSDQYVNIIDSYQNNLLEKQLYTMISVFAYGFISLMTIVCSANIFNGISTGMALRKREFAMLKSVGMTPEAFRKMLAYESLLYGLKALLYGLPISFCIMYFIYRTFGVGIVFQFTVPWGSVLFGIGIIFVVVGLSTWYSFSKLKAENVIDTLKEENI